MKNEIKEMLDNLRIYAGREENGFICDIEDYITNLQDRINKAVEILEQDKASASFNTAERIAINILKGE